MPIRVHLIPSSDVQVTVSTKLGMKTTLFGTFSRPIGVVRRVSEMPDEMPEMLPEDVQDDSLYARVGGHGFFVRLVDSFYAGVITDEVLWPLYPDQSDLEGAKERLTLFLIQYWGGPTTYMEHRGHPRLRLRHMPFHIGPQERDRWLVHMAAAVEATTNDPGLREELMAYFAPAAEHLRNDTGLPISSSRQSPSLGPK